MVKRREKKATLRTTKLLQLLKQCWLGGVLEEFVLVLSRGKGRVEAVDMTNSLVVQGQFTITDDRKLDSELGLGNVELLIKFLSNMVGDTLHIQVKENILQITRKDGRRRLNYLLTQPDLIGTQVTEEDDDEPPLDKIDSIMEHSVELTESFIKDFLSNISLLSTKDTALEFDGEEKVSFICGSPEDHQVELVLQSEVDNSGDEFTLQLNGEHIAKVFSVIDYDKESPPILKFAEDKPILLLTKGTGWALMPTTEERE